MTIGVAFFYGGAWMHCGLTDGRELIDSYPGRGVTRGPLPADAEIVWLPGDNTEAWRAAEARIGDRFEICAAFVCQCLGTRCILPTTLQARLQR